VVADTGGTRASAFYRWLEGRCHWFGTTNTEKGRRNKALGGGVGERRGCLVTSPMGGQRRRLVVAGQKVTPAVRIEAEQGKV